MADHQTCSLCSRRFTQHIPTITCTTCKRDVHTSCLPLYTDSDVEMARDINSHWTCPTCINILFPFSNIETADELTNLLQNSNKFDLKALEEMLFQPFDFEEDGGVLGDIDPDINYYNSQCSQITTCCKFIYPDPLEQELKEWPRTPELSVMHLNVRSLRKNYGDLNTLLETIDHKFTVIGLTET